MGSFYSSICLDSYKLTDYYIPLRTNSTFLKTSIDKSSSVREDEDMAVFSSKKRGLWLFIAAVFIFGLIGLSGWLFWKYQTVLQKLERLQDPTQNSEVEVESLIQAVGELIILPQEIPTIATITDKSKLENQPFFARAENGDKVLIYTTAQRAYLYRPSTNKLIDVASFNLTQPVEAE